MRKTSIFIGRPFRDGLRNSKCESSNGNSASASANATSTIYKPLSYDLSGPDLRFGNIIAGTGAGLPLPLLLDGTERSSPGTWLFYQLPGTGSSCRWFKTTVAMVGLSFTYFLMMTISIEITGPPG